MFIFTIFLCSYKVLDQPKIILERLTNSLIYYVGTDSYPMWHVDCLS